jgi:hypothetical protein
MEAALTLLPDTSWSLTQALVSDEYHEFPPVIAPIHILITWCGVYSLDGRKPYFHFRESEDSQIV